jgi:hypothetical protein
MKAYIEGGCIGHRFLDLATGWKKWRLVHITALLRLFCEQDPVLTCHRHSGTRHVKRVLEVRPVRVRSPVCLQNKATVVMIQRHSTRKHELTTRRGSR